MVLNPFRERMRLAVVEVEEVDEEAWHARSKACPRWH